MIMATDIHILRRSFQAGKSWENVGFVWNSWENVGARQFICDFIRFSDTNPKFTSMTIANLITSHGPNGSFRQSGLCYFMSSSRGILLPALVKVLNTALYIVEKRIKAFIVVQCRSNFAKDAIAIR